MCTKQFYEFKVTNLYYLMTKKKVFYFSFFLVPIPTVDTSQLGT